MFYSRELDLDRRDVLWIVAAGLLAGVFGIVAYDQLFNLHFEAWRLYTTRPSTEPLAEALRGPITGWYRPVVVLLAVIAGLGAMIRALQGRWRPLAAFVVGILILIVAIEVTQSAGQRATPTSEVDVVAPVSVVWVALLGLVPLVTIVVAGVGLLRHRNR